MRDLNFGMLIILTAISGGISNLFVYCYFGKMATESYEKMGDCLYESNWIELSPKLQKYLVIIIGNTHKPVYYSGFGLVVLNLLTFNKVGQSFYFSRIYIALVHWNHLQIICFADDSSSCLLLHDVQDANFRLSCFNWRFLPSFWSRKHSDNLLQWIWSFFEFRNIYIRFPNIYARKIYKFCKS